jgi:hypothetical protein
MSQTTTSDGVAGHRDDAPVRQDGAPEPRRAIRTSTGGSPRRPAAAFVVGGILCVVALVFLVGGGWALWKDRVDRDGKGFVSLGTTELQTEQYAIVGDLRGDGPSWLYGSTVLGDERVRATSQADQPVFIGIARKDDVFRYLRGAGYATVDSFEVRADTTHPGGAPSGPPSRESLWAASTQGTGRQTLTWTPRGGDWSVVFMNADAGANVDVRGDAGAKLPILPWLAGGLLAVAVASGVTGGWLVVGGIRARTRPGAVEGSRSP